MYFWIIFKEAIDAKDSILNKDVLIQLFWNALQCFREENMTSF